MIDSNEGIAKSLATQTAFTNTTSDPSAVNDATSSHLPLNDGAPKFPPTFDTTPILPKTTVAPDTLTRPPNLPSSPGLPDSSAKLPINYEATPNPQGSTPTVRSEAAVPKTTPAIFKNTQPTPQSNGTLGNANVPASELALSSSIYHGTPNPIQPVVMKSQSTSAVTPNLVSMGKMPNPNPVSQTTYAAPFAQRMPSTSSNVLQRQIQNKRRPAFGSLPARLMVFTVALIYSLNYRLIFHIPTPEWINARTDKRVGATVRISAKIRVNLCGILYMQLTRITQMADLLHMPHV